MFALHILMLFIVIILSILYIVSYVVLISSSLPLINYKKFNYKKCFALLWAKPFIYLHEGGTAY